MKKLILSVVLSAPLFLTAFPGFSAPSSTLYNLGSRTDGSNATLPTAGVKYAYHYNRWHRWHPYHRPYWHRGHPYHRHHWHRGHRWHRR
ncbi:MAG: hypothetical protein HYX60_01285 [Legionella longbeachae]|nr:hypothetical protein [Legionella longbeachae]